LIEWQTKKKYNSLSKFSPRLRVGKIPWEKTAAEQTFIAPVAGQFTLTISEFVERDRIGDETFDYVLTLNDSDERVLSRVAASDANMSYVDMRELYQTARRQALRVDQKLDSVLGELRKL
jgi:hypothetical protein